MALTFLEDMSDRASRLIPTPFAEIVDDATGEVNITPHWDRFFAICDFANTKPDTITDIVRAVRRRIDHKNAKVQYFTVMLLQTLVKSCGLPVHEEIAATKGMLRDLVTLCQKECHRDGDREARDAALQLVYNMSYWFDGHVSPKVAPLANLANYARTQGVNFEGVPRDDFKVLVEVQQAQGAAPRTSRRVPHSRLHEAQQQQASRQAAGTLAPEERQRRHQMQLEAQMMREDQAAQDEALMLRYLEPPRVADAIPVEAPTEAQIASFMDNVMLLVDCLNGIEGDPNGGGADARDYVSQVAMQVRREHKSVELILSAGVEVANMDILLSLSDSQLAVLDRLKSRTPGTTAPAPTPQVPSGPPVVLAPASSTSRPEESVSSVGPTAAATTTSATTPTGFVLPRAPPPAVMPTSTAPQTITTMTVAPPPPLPQPAAPSLDDLLASVGQSATASTSAAPAPHTAAAAPPAPRGTSAFPMPSQDMQTTRSAADTDFAHTDGPSPSRGTSINDDFDAFLDSRLQNNK